MKKIISILLAFTMIFAIMNIAYALPSKLTEVEAKAPGESADAVVTILGVIQWVGYAIALGMLIYIGIKYTMAAANEKADLKKGSINYVIGAIVIAGAVTICEWIVSVGAGLETSSTGEQPGTEQTSDAGNESNPGAPAIGGTPITGEE